MENDVTRPAPTPSIESAPYWQAMNEERLVLQRCVSCGRLRHYPRPVCDQCHSMDYDWVAASGRGRVHSWTVIHHAFHPGFRDALPYVLVIAELDEGVRIQAPLRDAGAESLRLDLPVEMTFEKQRDGSTLPAFRLATPRPGPATE